MRTILLRLVHYLIALGEFLRYLVLFAPSQAFVFARKSAQTPLSIQSDSKSLKKLPSHVGLLVAEDDFSFKDLANMIVWSVSLGISYLTIYDINGEIKRNSLLLQRNIDESKEHVMGHDSSHYDIQLFSSSHPLVHRSTGTSKSRHCCVHLLCVEDGQRKIVNMSRHLSDLVCRGSYSLQDIQPCNVDSFFQESMQFPDPELCVKFGNVDSLLGYLPWQVRLTEFISLPSHKGISYKSFLSSIVQFGNTAQRFGK
ncbi:dehydrodolichyl diphosphate synthase complex subunit nus1 [Aplysia californica]|uniref:ditrans,polycis-polyprenyl diphosphate synthase [(2E,6E)-farnesyldiphosphate specific] n=1 Tax=Aplysia californica TaxID=6500 RepID=A0ABM0JWQ2_APLCA|nr:dehydrodolichyl diphosphate synthase complex subunit nus1 [Aplysia californica]